MKEALPLSKTPIKDLFSNAQIVDIRLKVVQIFGDRVPKGKIQSILSTSLSELTLSTHDSTRML